MKLLRYVIGTAAALLLASSAADGAHVTTVRSAVARDAAGSSSDITNPDRNNSSPTMAVTGQGSVDITTDLLRVDMTISKNMNCLNKPLDKCNAAGLQKSVNQILQKVLDLKDELDGVESFQTQGLDLSTSYDYINGSQVFKGYRSSVQLVAIVKNDVVGQFLSELLKRGVKSIDNTQYYVSDKQRKDAQKKSLTLATENALKQADAILGALGKSRLDVKTIDIPYNSDPFVSTQVTPGTLLSGSSSPVTNGLLTVSYKVKMRVQY